MTATRHRGSRPARRGCIRLFGVVLAAGALWLVWKAATWPAIAGLAAENPQTTAFIERFKESRLVSLAMPGTKAVGMCGGNIRWVLA